MSPLSARVLVAVAVVAGIVTWAVLDVLDPTAASVPQPWTVPVLLVVLAGAVLSVGRPVRRWNQGRRDRPLDALRAARTVVVAQAAGVTGAALAGAYAGLVALLVPMVDIEVRLDRLWLGLAAMAASLLLLVAGVVVERWCRLPPEDRDGRAGGQRSTGSSRDGDVRRSAE